jgi:hypothetical protein
MPNRDSTVPARIAGGATVTLTRAGFVRDTHGNLWCITDPSKASHGMVKACRRMKTVRKWTAPAELLTADIQEKCIVDTPIPFQAGA